MPAASDRSWRRRYRSDQCVAGAHRPVVRAAQPVPPGLQHPRQPARRRRAAPRPPSPAYVASPALNRAAASASAAPLRAAGVGDDHRGEVVPVAAALLAVREDVVAPAHEVGGEQVEADDPRVDPVDRAPASPPPTRSVSVKLGSTAPVCRRICTYSVSRGTRRSCRLVASQSRANRYCAHRGREPQQRRRVGRAPGPAGTGRAAPARPAADGSAGSRRRRPGGARRAGRARPAAGRAPGASRPGSVPSSSSSQRSSNANSQVTQVGEQPDRGPSAPSRAGAGGELGGVGPAQPVPEAGVGRGQPERVGPVDAARGDLGAPRRARRRRTAAGSSAVAANVAQPALPLGRRPDPDHGRGSDRRGNGSFGQRRLRSSAARRAAGRSARAARRSGPGWPAAGRTGNRPARRARRPAVRRSPPAPVDDLAVARAPAPAARPGTGAAASRASVATRFHSACLVGLGQVARLPAGLRAAHVLVVDEELQPCWSGPRSAGC